MSKRPTPNDRKYSKTHEWVKIQGGLAVAGITDHAQESLGDITFIELPGPGKKTKKGESVAVIESVKAASDIYAPLSGEIAESNKAIETAPEQINKDPYDNGWLIKIKNFSADEASNLMDAAAYDSFVEGLA
jgi:glycine cleavage system H protein